MELVYSFSYPDPSLVQFLYSCLWKWRECPQPGDFPAPPELELSLRQQGWMRLHIPQCRHPGQPASETPRDAVLSPFTRRVREECF